MGCIIEARISLLVSGTEGTAPNFYNSPATGSLTSPGEVLPPPIRTGHLEQLLKPTTTEPNRQHWFIEISGMDLFGLHSPKESRFWCWWWGEKLSALDQNSEASPSVLKMNLPCKSAIITVGEPKPG